MTLDDWYHCCRKENVKVLRYADIDHVWEKYLKGEFDETS